MTTYAEAQEHLANGHRIRRPHWSAGVHVYLDDEIGFPRIGRGDLRHDMLFIAADNELFADDWSLIEA